MYVHQEPKWKWINIGKCTKIEKSTTSVLLKPLGCQTVTRVRWSTANFDDPDWVSHPRARPRGSGVISSARPRSSYLPHRSLGRCRTGLAAEEPPSPLRASLVNWMKNKCKLTVFYLNHFIAWLLYACAFALLNERWKRYLLLLKRIMSQILISLM